MTEGTIQQLQTLYMREENEITEACIKKKKKSTCQIPTKQFTTMLNTINIF